MKKKLLFIVVLAMLLSTTAYAGILGGKWTSNPTYNISSSNAYYTAVTNAASSWNNAFSSISSSMRISYTSSVLSATVSVLTNYYGETGWHAQGAPGPNYYSGTYTYATLRINRTYMDDYSSTKKKAICTHEFGHILGLAHNSYTSPRTLMFGGGSSVYYDIWGISTPQTNDISDLNSIY